MQHLKTDSPTACHKGLWLFNLNAGVVWNRCDKIHQVVLLCLQESVCGVDAIPKPDFLLKKIGTFVGETRDTKNPPHTRKVSASVRLISWSLPWTPKPAVWPTCWKWCYWDEMLCILQLASICWTLHLNKQRCFDIEVVLPLDTERRGKVDEVADDEEQDEGSKW